MKKELFKKNILLDSISNTLFFKIIMFLSFGTIYYGVYSIAASNNDFLSSIVYVHSFDYFNIMIMLIIFLNTINNCIIISENHNYIIRLKNRENFVKEIIKTNFVMNLYWSLIFLFLFLAVLCFNKISFFKIYTMNNYDVNIVYYVLFYICRYYLFSLLISTISCLIFIKFKKSLTYIFMGICTFGFLFIGNSDISVNKFQIVPWSYFKMLRYPSFSKEICYSVLYLIILETIIIVLYKLCVNNKKMKFRNLYFLTNDLQYFLKNSKLIIILYFIYPFIFASINSNLNGDFIFQSALGLNIENNGIYYLSLISYLFNIFICMYIFIHSFIKDYSNISNIYIRYNYKKYYYVKTLINIILLFVLKFVQYSLLFILVRFVYNKSINDIISLFIKDYHFILYICNLGILFYVLFNLNNNFIRFIIVILFLFSINIINISRTNFIVYLGLIIIILFITNYIIVKNNKKVIQEIGGV